MISLTRPQLLIPLNCPAIRFQLRLSLRRGILTICGYPQAESGGFPIEGVAEKYSDISKL